MGLFDLFTQKRDPEPSAAWLPLTVLYATDREGLSAEDGFALRDIINADCPIDFQFLSPGSFVVFFPDSTEGKAHAEHLSSELMGFARQAGLSAFCVGVEIGPCLVSQDAGGRFTSRPLGETISRAMQTAIAGATNAH